jgi:hypothetical protein
VPCRRRVHQVFCLALNNTDLWRSLPIATADSSSAARNTEESDGINELDGKHVSA